jgi:hypothetical protein
MTDLPSWDYLDALVDTDPIKPRDVAFDLTRRLETMTAVAQGNKRHVAMLVPDVDRLEAIREYVARWPEFTDDVTGDPEAMVVRNIRNLLKENQ